MTKAILCVLAVAAIAAAASPTFEVASVKVSKAPDAAVLFSPGMVDAVSGKWRVPRAGGIVTMRNWTLSGFLAAAFDLGPGEVSGPDWLNSDRFDIVAKASPSATQAELRIMLQTLLAERFQLVSHRERKEQTVLALVVAKGGPKLEAAKGDAQLPVLFAPPSRLIGQGSTMAQLALALHRPAGRPVVDKTGIAGRFDFTLNFAPEVDAAGIGDVAAPVFQSLTRQLGLKLQPQKELIEILVVDRAERNPLAN